MSEGPPALIRSAPRLRHFTKLASMQLNPSRRDFLASLSAAGAASMLGPRASLADEGPPETATLRLRHDPGICVAPWYVAEELLRNEGFTDIRYVRAQSGPETAQMLARGEIHFALYFAASTMFRLDRGLPIKALAGVHAGCLELFAHESVRTISDLKGKKVAITEALGSATHLYVAVMAAQVGLNPDTDIEWFPATAERGSTKQLFVDRKVDAFLAGPPEPQELRARKIGRVILSTTTDKPWSQYFCCMMVGNRDFVHDHPIATKRVLRAVLKANEVCAAEPERIARRLVDGGFTERYDYALQTLTELPYASWREFDPEDSLRFYALRLHEVGIITSSPNSLLAEGTDWRFLNEIKRELKA